MKISLLLLAATLSASAAPPHYFLTTAAGMSPSLSAPIALNQPPIARLVAYDAKGNLYYANGNHVWRLNGDGTDTLIAGTYDTSEQFANGQAAVDAPLSGISDLKFNTLGNLFVVAETPAANITANVYKVVPGGAITTFAGNGLVWQGSAPTVGPNIPATSLNMNVEALAVDENDVVYLKIPVVSSGNTVCWEVLSIPPGGGSSALVATGGAVGAGVNLSCPQGVSGNLVADGLSLFTAQGQPGTRVSFRISLPGGPGQQAEAIPPNLGTTLSIAPNGSLIVLDPNGGLDAIDPQSLASEPLPNSSSTSGAEYIAVNPVTGDVALVNSTNSVSVFSIQAGTTRVVACNAPVFSGDNGPATLAAMGETNLVADASGSLYLADARNHRIRKITPDGVIATIAGTGTSGDNGDQGAALQAEISPGAMALDGAGNLYFINAITSQSSSIRKIDRSGIITTVAGGGTGSPVNGALAPNLKLDVSALAFDSAGDLLLGSGAQLWEMNGSGTIQLLAGTGVSGSISPGSPAITANLPGILSVAVSKSGTVYFASGTGVWMIDTQGNLQEVAGENLLHSPSITHLLAAGPATSVLFDDAEFLQIDAQGNLYFYADAVLGNPQLVMVDTGGNLTPIGGGGQAVGTSSGDGGDATLGTFQDVYGLTLDPMGNLYVSDANIIRRMSPYDPASPPPYLSLGGVIGAGGSLPAVAAVSPGGEVSIFGGNFVSAANAHTVTNADLVNGKIPTNLVGVCATFGGSPAAMLGVYPNQLNVQVGALTPGAVNVQVTTNCGTPQAVTSNYSGVVVQAASPEFYSFKPDPVGGQNPIAAVNALTGAFIGPSNLLPGATFVAAKAGDIVQAYATGFGATSPSYGLGVIPGAAGTLTNPYSLTLGAAAIPAANIAYAGISPCCAGFYQIDFTVPSGIPSGAQPLVMTIAGVDSPPLAYIQIGQ